MLSEGDVPHLRIARPCRDLDQARQFWVDGVGAEVLWSQLDPEPGHHALMMIGLAKAAWHLELVLDPDCAAASPPSEEDLLVLYLDGEVPSDLIERILAAGGVRVPARNPYWDQWGSTFVDPDGYRLVLSTRAWG